MFRVQGAFLCHIRPAFLLDIQEFKHWCSLQVELFIHQTTLCFVCFVLHSLNTGDVSVLYTNEIEWINGCPLPTHLYTLLLLQLNKEENSFDYSCVDYESLSKRSWTDVLLQIYKVENLIFCLLSFWLILSSTTNYSSAHVQVLVLSRVSQSNMNNSFDHKITDEILQFSPQSLPSNIYSCRELQLLSWVNMHYQSSRETLWKKGRTHGMHTYFITLKLCNDAGSQCTLTFSLTNVFKVIFILNETSSLLKISSIILL